MNHYYRLLLVVACFCPILLSSATSNKYIFALSKIAAMTIPMLFVVLLCSCYTTTNSLQSRAVLLRKAPTTTVLSAVTSTKTGQLLDEIDLSSLTAGTTTSSKSMERIFQASTDGWSANAFHKAVNFNPPLPVFAIMKTTSGVVAGCYNAIGWQSRDDYRESTKSFLFRVVKGSDGAVEKVILLD